MPLKNKPNNEELIDNNNPNYGNKKKSTSKSEYLQEKEYKLESIPGTKSLLFDFESRWEEVERKKIEVLNQIKQNNEFYALNNNKNMNNEHHKVIPNSARREKEPASRPINNNTKNNNFNINNSNNNKNLHKENNQGNKGNVPNRYVENYNRQHENLFDIKLRDKFQENLVTENNNFDNFIQRKEQEMNENVQKNQEKTFDGGNKQLNKDYSNKNIIQEGKQHGNFSFLKNKNEIQTNSRKEEGSSKHLNDNSDNTNNYNFNKKQNKFENIYNIFNVIPKKENKEEVKNKNDKNFDFESIINQVERQQLFKNKKTLINNIMSKNENIERFNMNEDKFIYPVGGNKFKNKK